MSEQPIKSFRSEKSLNALTRLCEDWLTPDMVMAELGSFAGESTVVFARHVGRVYAIDPWDNLYHQQVTAGCANPDILQRFEKRLVASMQEIERLFDERTIDFNNITKLKMTGDEAFSVLPEKLDFVYIDSIHTYQAVQHDIKLWLLKIQPTGLIGGHDYCPTDWPGVVRAVHELLGPPHALYEDTSWLWCADVARF